MATDYVAHHLDRVGSTQDLARDLFESRPVLVTAVAQEHGRGRAGSGWLNAPRALAASVAMRLDWPDSHLGLVTLVAGLAGRAALSSDLMLKWPNDVVDRRDGKVAGLLAERVENVIVIGMGVNLFWPDPPDGVAAVFEQEPDANVGPVIAEEWAGDLLRRLAGGPDAWDRDEYEEASATIGREVAWDDGGAAKAVGIDPTGGLIVERHGRRDILRSGRVRHVRPTTLTD